MVGAFIELFFHPYNVIKNWSDGLMTKEGSIGRQLAKIVPGNCARFKDHTSKLSDGLFVLELSLLTSKFV